MILLTNGIGIIFYIILCYICYHTYEMRYIGSGKYVRNKKVSMPYWTLLIVLVCLFLPPTLILVSLISLGICSLHFITNSNEYEVDIPIIKFLCKSIYKV